ncbi:MAG TPA: energy transducer TonB [Vicinamibacterales bacterium]|jgi:protein TonB
MTPIVRETAQVIAIAGLVTVLAAPVRRSDQLPPPPGMTMVFRAEPPPPPPVRLHAGMPMPLKLVDRTPAYPAAARTRQVAGNVVLDIVIDRQGLVTVTRVIKSIPLLDQAAIDTVHQWRFAPSLVNGEAVAVATTVTVEFALRH